MEHLNKVDRFLALASEGWLNRWYERLHIPIPISDNVLGILESRLHSFEILIKELRKHERKPQ